MIHRTRYAMLIAALLFAPVAAEAGAVPNAAMKTQLEVYAKAARGADQSFKGFSAEAGKKLYFSERMHGVEKELRSCATCHTKDPLKAGRTVVGKPIEPVAPSVNPERFTDVKKVEKWFGRNCKWVFERECTPKEKGDYITYMFSL